MENTPEAAPQGTEAVPQTAPIEPTKAEAPEINAEQVAKFLGTDAETFGKFQKFVEANGKFDSAFSKMKADISNPAKPAEPAAKPAEAPAQQPQSQPEAPAYKAPEGSISPQEFLAHQYFKGLSQDPKYAGISEQIANGDILKEMAAFNIQALNQDGSLNDGMVRKFLDLKAQTVPAKPTAAEPDASAAPTVSYVNVGDKIENIDQAYQVIMQPNHPKSKEAEEFIKNHLNPNSDKKI